MYLPENLTLYGTAHGTGRNGMYFYDYEDDAAAGLHLHIRRESRKHGETRQWRHVSLPDQVFDTLNALQEALALVTPEQDTEERAKWPKLESRAEDPTLNNRCRLCPREPHVRATHRVEVRKSWIPRDLAHYAGLCDAHHALSSDPAGLIAALDAEVAERKARHSARLAATVAERAACDTTKEGQSNG